MFSTPTYLVLAIAALHAMTPVGVGAQARAPMPPTERIDLSGPRVGLTWLSAGVHQKVRDEDIDIAPVISQFGWQFERQFYAVEGGPAAVTELVLLVGGLEQGTALPSLSWLVGLRTFGGTEFGVGPNVTLAGVALAIAGGATKQVGVLNIPFNVAVVPSQSGVRVSVLTGFNTR